MKQVKFEDLKKGDFITFSNRYSKLLGGGVRGTIIEKTEHGIRLNIDTPAMIVTKTPADEERELCLTIGIIYYSHHEDNEYWKHPELEIEEDETS